MFDRDGMLSHLTDEEREIGVRALDAAHAALKQGGPVATDFFDPYEQRIVKGVLGNMDEVRYRLYGGYRQAERQRFLLYPDYYLEELLSPPVSCLSIEGNFRFVKVSHRDFLGAMMALGMKRSVLGDLLPFDRGCQVVVADDVVGFIEMQMTQVHEVPVSVREIDPEQLNVEPDQVKEIKTTVASMRLDAVASSGYGTSRTRMAREIKAERVKVNWQPVNDPAHSVNQGDVLSIRGRGRVVVEEVRGTTRKGRTSLLLRRYI